MPAGRGPRRDACPGGIVVADVARVVPADDPHAGDRQRIGLPDRVVEADGAQLLEDPRAGVLGARLRARVGRGVDEQHVATGRRRRGGERRAGRAGADHEHVGVEGAHR